jgi:ribosomal protein L15E
MENKIPNILFNYLIAFNITGDVGIQKKISGEYEKGGRYMVTMQEWRRGSPDTQNKRHSRRSLLAHSTNEARRSRPCLIVVVSHWVNQYARHTCEHLLIWNSVLKIKIKHI